MVTVSGAFLAMNYFGGIVPVLRVPFGAIKERPDVYKSFEESWPSWFRYWSALSALDDLPKLQSHLQTLDIAQNDFLTKKFGAKKRQLDAAFLNLAPAAGLEPATQ